MESSNNIQQFNDAVSVVADAYFFVGIIIGLVSAFVIREIAAIVVPFLRIFVCAERKKRGLPCNCEYCCDVVTDE